MENTDPLFALLEVMIRQFTLPRPNVKPGGYPEEMFTNLKEEDKEKYECSICYQILKEARECSNKHKFCYTCIFVWSTSGPPSNHGKCPVCRTDGFYTRNKDIDEEIGFLDVKCSLPTCRWTGILRHHGAHQHTNYNTTKKTTSEEGVLTDLPTVENRSRSAHRTENTGNARGTNSPRRRITRQSARRRRNTPTRSTSQNTENGATRALNYTATGLTTNRHGRLLARQQILNTGENQSPRPQQTIQNNSDVLQPSLSSSGVSSPMVPHPPSVPRPEGPQQRRVPTLPSIIDSNNNRLTQMTQTHRYQTIPVVIPPTRTPQTQSEAPRNNFQQIRDRLTESRNRLDTLMGAFQVELDRGRREIQDFQEERERRRQEQLEEVRDLGRRLGHVAQELRRLLSQRRQIRNELDDLVDSDES